MSRCRFLYVFGSFETFSIVCNVISSHLQDYYRPKVVTNPPTFALGKTEGERYRSLAKFVQGLDRLATLDRLGHGEGKVNCFDAIEGVAKSLNVLFATEEGQVGTPDVVMCERSGHPVWHAGDQVGFMIQYWQDQRIVQRDTAPIVAAMEVDDKVNDRQGPETANIWSAMITCEACPADTYAPARG